MLGSLAPFELITVIVNFGLGSKVMQLARECGIKGSTVCLGKGTVSNSVLEFLGLSDIRKEIVLMVSDKVTADKAIQKINDKFGFEKPNHGIGFTTSVCSVVGSKNTKCDKTEDRRGENIMYQAIVVVVDRGKAEYVIDAATKAGSKGGTIINARGSGIHETKRLFLMDIEPEKEIVLILSKTETVDAIVSSIREELKIDEPGNGIIFVQDVNRTYGLAE
jgi:nitrogen regulatory protein PII